MPTKQEFSEALADRLDEIIKDLKRRGREMLEEADELDTAWKEEDIDFIKQYLQIKGLDDA